MGAAPSLAKFLHSMEDEELINVVEEVRLHDAHLVLLPAARLRCVCSRRPHEQTQSPDLVLTRSFIRLSCVRPQAYRVDPSRIERVLAVAKLRSLEKTRASYNCALACVSKYVMMLATNCSTASCV